MSKTVYLAGPILGLDKDQANNWRHYAADVLKEHNIIGISPLRKQEMRSKDGKYGYGTLKTTGSKNEFDVRNCDVTLAYLPTPVEGRHQSYGTLLEIAWAKMLNKPVIIITDDPEVKNHMVIDYCANWVVDDFDARLEIAVALLSGYAGGKNV